MFSAVETCLGREKNTSLRIKNRKLEANIMTMVKYNFEKWALRQAKENCQIFFKGIV